MYTAPPHCSRTKAYFVLLLPLRSPVLPCAPPVLLRCSLTAPPCSLAAFSKAALLPFLIENGISKSKFSVYIIYIYNAGSYK